MTVKQEFTKGGDHWKLLERGPKLALYQRRMDGVTSWEVVGIGKTPKKLSFGNAEPVWVDQEFLQLSSRDYDVNTWTFDNKDQAQSWFNFHNNQ